MRNRPFFWLVVSLLSLAGAIYCWRLGEEWAGRRPAGAGGVGKAARVPEPRTVAVSPSPLALLSVAANGARSESRTNWQGYRLRNTAQLEQVLFERAILLENAVIDTGRPWNWQLPESLRRKAASGSYVVQARGAVDESFRRALSAAGAQIISFIPNNAFLVRVSAAGAERLKGEARTQAVLAWEPVYKLKAGLLKLGMEERALPPGALLNVVVFADARGETESAMTQAGAEVLAEGRTPFGPVLTVRPGADWVALARLPGVQVLELYHERVGANDLSRVRVGVSEDPVVTTNYLGLTGDKVLVNINDTGVDATHPDLAGRVSGDFPLSLQDKNGHGTHLAGVIAGSGLMSTNPVNVGSNAPGSISGADFRGKAPGSKLFALVTGLEAGLFQSDAYLQETAAKTNALISNNSWHFGGDNTYGIGAANYDAAVRDALPEVPGSQPLLFVFPAGNNGNGDDAGFGAEPESVLSPGTAKNVITVGAIEQLRSITNQVWKAASTNQPWLGMTDSDNQVAAFSGRGNVGVGIEGEFGRYKPDVVAPGVFVVSTRSAQWDEAAYYNPTNHHINTFFDQVALTNEWKNYSLQVPANAVAASITVLSGANLPVFVRLGGPPGTNNFDFVGTNQVSLPVPPQQVEWSYSVGNPTAQNVDFTLVTDVVTTNDNGNYFQVLSNLNNSLAGTPASGIPPHYYRYESGTSVAAADVSGTLALMQEFFEQRLHVTISPALLKALLINGARQVRPEYDFQVRTPRNDQGWGLINLPNSVPLAESNVLAGMTHEGPASLELFDQSPASALATGQSQTRRVSVTEDARGSDLPLRVTLVWTDPPGNPAAGVKLVNDLDLIVTNLDTGEVYLGNDIEVGSVFTHPWATNGPPNPDAVNNVENVYLNAPLGSNYSVTVVGRHVNVNAVTAHANDVAQDYALVISCGNGEVPDALTLTAVPPLLRETTPLLTVLANTFTNSPTISGSLLLGQHVGANTPLLGTTNGMTNQWHFYVITNTAGYTNAAFVTFLPPDLSLPRLGVREASLDNATRVEADIDLYVSLNPGLLRLDPAVLASADKSRSRGGTELVAYSNAAPGQVYYIGVKAEDQMAAEYAFLGVFSLEPFGQRENGNLILRGLPLPAVVSDGNPAAPGAALVLGLALESVSVRRVVVTNELFHENLGDLVGNLSHGQQFAVLNNHRGRVPGVFDYNYVYEDNGEDNLHPTDGPGSLRSFVGEEGFGVWLLVMADNSPNYTGRVERLNLRLEPQNVNSNGTTRLLPPNTWTYDFIDVPVAGSNLIVCVSGNTQPVELYLRAGAFPTRTTYDQTVTVPAGGGCLSLDKSDLPPLTSGRYFLGVYNSSGVAQNIRLLATVLVDVAAIVPVTHESVGGQPLRDDAVSYANIQVRDIPNPTRIATVEVGLRIDHPRVSDLAVTIVSPKGTRVLLMESRGGTQGSSTGSSVLVTNVTRVDSGFESVAAGTYGPGAVVENWTVTNAPVTVIQNAALAHSPPNALALRTGTIQRNFSTAPGDTCTLTYAYRKVPTLDGIVSWWPGEGAANDVVDGNAGALSAGAGYVPGEVQQAFDFNGVDGSVIVADSANLRITSTITLEAWINPRTTIGDRSIATKVGGTGGNNHGYQLAMSNGRLVAQFNNPAQIWPGNVIVQPVGLIPNGVWTHVAWTYDQSTMRLYVNGSQVATSIIGAQPIATDISRFRIGCDDDPHTFFDGLIDEVSVYNRALSAAEVQNIHAAGSAGKCGMLFPPANCLSLAGRVSVVGVTTNAVIAFSTYWLTNVITFQATQTNTLVEFASAGGNSGLMFDTISLVRSNVAIQNSYLTFTEDTNRTTTPIKFAAPPFNTSSTATNFFLSGFEPAVAGDYVAPAVVDGWSVLTTNRVSVLNDPLLTHTGAKSLNLQQGQIQRTLSTTVGRNYTLTWAARSPTNCSQFTDFASTEGLALTGNAASVGGALRLTPALEDQLGNAWLVDKRQCSTGFDTRFHFSLGGVGSRPGTPAGGDGFAFVVQNLGPAPMDYFGRLGAATSCAGVYFNTFLNWPGCNDYQNCDVSDNSVGVIINSIYVAQTNLTPLGINLKDGAVHDARIVFDGSTLTVWLDNVQVLANVPLPGMAPGTDSCGRGWVGFSAKTGWAWENHDVLDWSFCSAQSPSAAQVFVPGLITNTFAGTGNWATQSLSFIASQNNTPLGVVPGDCSVGMLLDTFTLREAASSLYYLPEEKLSALVNENAYGEWRLEILDTRTGASNQVNLLGWQLQFVFQTDVPLPGVLVHGVPQTNTVPAGQIAYYVVDVPAWARFATNRLLFANGLVNLLFNQNRPPTGTNAGDFTLFGPVNSGSATLSAGSAPVLVPGARYYLGVQNPGVTAVTYALEVDFDITPLQNGVPVSGLQDVGGLPRYFSYDVTSNGTAVTYQLLNLSGNVDLVARQGAPLPTQASFDYGSSNPGTNDEEIVVFRDSTPVALRPGRWYLGVYNADVVPVNYTILATEYTNAFPPIITLTNGIPYPNTNNAAGNGADYYRYVVTADAVRAQFEINHPSADLTLVARKGLLPPDLTTFDYLSANPFTNDELIVLFKDSTPVPLAPGSWYLTAVNLSGGPVSYSILATEWPLTGRPLVITGSGVVSNEFCLTWTSLPGVHYYVQGLTNLNGTNWVTVSPTITASDYATSWCVGLPSEFHFFRVVEGLALNWYVPPPVITSIVWTNNVVELRWQGPLNARYRVQWTAGLVPPGWNPFTNVVTSPNTQYVFVDDGTQTGGLGPTRFYRLVQLP